LESAKDLTLVFQKLLKLDKSDCLLIDKELTENETIAMKIEFRV